jgi:hypothetical protein
LQQQKQRETHTQRGVTSRPAKLLLQQQKEEREREREREVFKLFFFIPDVIQVPPAATS